MSDLAPISSHMHPPAYANRTHVPASFIDAKPSAAQSDRVELSDRANFLQMMRDMPEIRHDRVARAKQAIAQGVYDSPEKLEAALERMIEDLG